MRLRQADNNTINPSFCLVDKTRHEPDLVVSALDSRVQFHIMNNICRQYGLTRMPFYDISVNETKLLFLSSAVQQTSTGISTILI